MADSLSELLAVVRRDLPDIPLAVWVRIESNIRLNFGGQNHYIAAHKKRHLLQTLSELGEQEDNARLAEILGVSVRRVQQLQKLK